MKIVYAFTFLIFYSMAAYSQPGIAMPKKNIEFQEASKTWFTAWELVSRDIFNIHKINPVAFVFFDDQYVYSTSDLTIPLGEPVDGPGLMGLDLHWKRALHHDSLRLPDSSSVPVALMSFAAPDLASAGNSFFVMPLPSFWQKSGVSSNKLQLSHLVTGVFLHEFSHSQQMQNFGRQVSYYEEQLKLDHTFSDDIVQEIFGTDPVYVSSFNKESNLFYTAFHKKNLDKKLVQTGLSLIKQRHREFFKGPYDRFAEVDALFLTMEGLGQYAMYCWLTHPRGGGYSSEVAIAGVRRGKKWWSQEEGFALFLLAGRLQKPSAWAFNMFGEKTGNIVTLLAGLVSK